jgi:hypothetical protein
MGVYDNTNAIQAKYWPAIVKQSAIEELDGSLK